jgi:hypothetical protein
MTFISSCRFEIKDAKTKPFRRSEIVFVHFLLQIKRRKNYAREAFPARREKRDKRAACRALRRAVRAVSGL